MLKAPIATITVSFIIVMSTLLVVPASHGSLGELNFATASTIGDIHNSSLTAPANFTMYVPQNTYDIAVAQSSMNFFGITPHKFGLLWTFSVPENYASTVNETLHRLTASTGITFFYTERNAVVNPSLSYSYTGQDLNIPFAFTPGLLSRAYNFTWPLSHGINGTGITIGIVDAYGNPNIMYDLKAFDAVNGLPAPNLTFQYPDGQPGTYNSTWAMETSTDVEWAHALAPGAKLVLIVSTSSYTSNLQDVVSYAVSNHLANILSLSWGTPESSLPASSEQTYSQVYAQAASEGITVLAASGDNGAYSAGGGQLTVNFPASSPYVTGVGGTSLYAVNNKFQESGWGGTLNGQSYGSGGGYSTVFNTPYWQSVKGYKDTRRGVPDVALDANKYTGVYVISGGAQYIVGGTSVATPIWADVVALMEQYTGVHLQSVNPILYQIARTSLYNSSFNQILTGTNGYYQNTPYWNPVTGLGTPKVAALLNATKAILAGYGGVVVFNGTSSYNATSISADLNLTTLQGNLAMNGTTFYYEGFYLNPENYVKFGVTLNSSGENLLLMISQAGIKVTDVYSMPTGSSLNLSMFNIETTLNPSSITVSAGGIFSQTIPTFLTFYGEMYPAIGTSQIGSQTNLTVIAKGTFSAIALNNGSGPISPYFMYFQHYSELNSSTYSTIDASASSGQIQFFSSQSPEAPISPSSTNTGPYITYSQSYGAPPVLAFNLIGVTSTVQWSVNSTSLKSNTYEPTHGGVYDINATYTGSNGLSQTATREIAIPNMHMSNVSVNYSIPGNLFPGTKITTMWFYSYNYFTPGMHLPAMNGSTVGSATSPGFYGESTTFTGSENLSFSLSPMPVRVSMFVFNTNASVTVNNASVNQSGGYHYGSFMPGTTVNINVTKEGYQNLSEYFNLQPGNNLSLQAGLLPSGSNFHPVSGVVTDILYSFPVSDATISINSTVGSYTNSTGIYFLYPVTGKYDVGATAPLYDNYSTPLNITAPTQLNIRLTPAKISINPAESIKITHYFPLLFYFGFLSWTPYQGKNFSIYQLYISNNQNFLNPTIQTVGTQNTTYTFLTGLIPGNTYYVSVVLRLSNSQVFQSQVVKISYSNPVYLGINLILAGAIGFYGYIGYRVFSKKKRKIEI